MLDIMRYLIKEKNKTKNKQKYGGKTLKWSWFQPQHTIKKIGKYFVNLFSRVEKLLTFP